MRKFIAILIACQLLINSGLALAHSVTDVQDPHEAVHVHTGGDHHGHDSEHDDGHGHVHLCALALSSIDAGSAAGIDIQLPATSSTWITHSSSPPVPPPNA